MKLSCEIVMRKYILSIRIDPYKIDTFYKQIQLILSNFASMHKYFQLINVIISVIKFFKYEKTNLAFKITQIVFQLRSTNGNKILVAAILDLPQKTTFAWLDFSRLLICYSGDLSDHKSKEKASVAICGGSFCILTGLLVPFSNMIGCGGRTYQSRNRWSD